MIDLKSLRPFDPFTQISAAEMEHMRHMDGNPKRLRAERDAMIAEAQWWRDTAIKLGHTGVRG